MSKECLVWSSPLNSWKYVVTDYGLCPDHWKAGEWQAAGALINQPKSQPRLVGSSLQTEHSACLYWSSNFDNFLHSKYMYKPINQLTA